MSTSLILAIDPGTTESAWVMYNPVNRKLVSFEKEPNRALLEWLEEGTGIYARGGPVGTAVIEKIESNGMPVGSEVFETVFWSGRFAQALAQRGVAVARLPRRAVKLHLNGTMRGSNDSTVRQALIDKFGPGKKAIGTKKAPGPLYGVAGDVWAALAVAVTFAETGGAK